MGIAAYHYNNAILKGGLLIHLASNCRKYPSAFLQKKIGRFATKRGDGKDELATNFSPWLEVDWGYPWPFYK